ncbi:hypothetical protein N665_3927s0003, partial [Sinapis alba]
EKGKTYILSGSPTTLTYELIIRIPSEINGITSGTPFTVLTTFIRLRACSKCFKSKMLFYSRTTFIIWYDRKLVKDSAIIRCSFFSRDESKNMILAGWYIYLSMINCWVPGLTLHMKHSSVS